MDLLELVQEHRKAGIKWKIYPNPMREDGVFVAEDKPLEPYKEVRGFDGSREGYAIFPAIPNTKHSIGFQLPHSDAEELAELLNKE